MAPTSQRSNPGKKQAGSLPSAVQVPVSPGVALSQLGESWNAPEQGEATAVQAVKSIRRLPHNVKQFIVINNACGASPSEVVRAVKSVFDLEVSATQVERYDPTKVSGQSLSLELKSLFRTMQREYQRMVVKAGVADQKWRLSKLHLIAQHALDRGDYARAMQALEQAAKEIGGFYDRRGSLPVDDKRALLAKLLRCAPEELPGVKDALPLSSGQKLGMSS